MIEKVKSYIERYHMMKKDDHLVAGVSGGADSVCLLLVLRELSREIGFSLSAVHVEHGIRGEESRGDAVFTEKLCGKLGIPCEVFSVDVPGRCRETGQSLEEAARELRYNCFFQACSRFGADMIAVAHHANDSAETMLFHLARGTGIRGLGGIAPVTERNISGWGDDENPLRKNPQNSADLETVRIVRPLLCVTGEEIRAWLTAQGKTWRTDSTNADAAYARNRIRGQIVPELEQVNTQAVLHMQRTGEQLREISAFLDEEAYRAGQGAWEQIKRSDGEQEIHIFCAAFAQIHPFLQKHLLLLLLGMQAESRKDIASCHVEEVLGLMTQGVGRKISLPYSMTARRTYDSVILSRDSGAGQGAGQQCLSCELQIPGETVWGNGLWFRTKLVENPEFFKKIPEKRYTKWFDYDKIKFIVQLRTRKTGDFLQVNAAGGRKTLKKYFIEEKIPREERDRICLLADGDHVIWVIGHRISEAYKVDGQTRRILQVEVMRSCLPED
ncbi:MAG: tRNA lysidine(34) synthetase TilS [Clostridiales bacterium]|nr:tRNA lysidine(34) synthetase TilS [Clostridiales bacterium]